MELLSVIVALESLKIPQMEVTIFSDSRYVVDSVSKGWVFDWNRKGFHKKKNKDLWKRFLLIYPTQKIKFHWVKGHASNVENERCDELAVAAAQSSHLHIDKGYEANEAEDGLAFD